MYHTRNVLLAEDNADEALLVQWAWKKVKLPGNLQIVRYGQEAVDYLEGEGKYADRDKYPLPDLVLLDIKMPKRTGLEVLEWIRHQEPLARLPVVIVSSSQIQSDVNRAHELGVNAYLVKPVDFDEFFRILQILAEFFIKYAVRPELPVASRH